MRNSDMLIKEAELVASSPERVFAWLETHCVYSEGHETVLDKEAEKALLDRGEPLVDLALARFGQHDGTLTELFSRATTVNSDNPRERAMRFAMLGNQAINGSFGIPVALFSPKSDGLVRWLSQASDDERVALFRNPRINQTFLQDFLECKGPWEALDDDARRLAIRGLSSNARMKMRYSGNMDGYAEYSHGSIFRAAWKLAATLPPSREWADALGGLLDALPTESHGMDDALAIAERWRPAANDTAGLAEEEKLPKNGYAWSYSLVRKSLARLAASQKREIRQSLLASRDAAVRDAAYSHCDMTPELILTAYELDKNLAVNSCQRNLWIWRRPESRKALHDISWKACGELNSNHMDSANAYNYFAAENKKQHPEWFKDEEDEVDESMLPGTKADLEAIKAAVGGNEYLIRESITMSAQITQIAKAINSRLGWVWWFSLGALAASVIYRL